MVHLAGRTRDRGGRGIRPGAGVRSGPRGRVIGSGAVTRRGRAEAGGGERGGGGSRGREDGLVVVKRVRGRAPAPPRARGSCPGRRRGGARRDRSIRRRSDDRRDEKTMSPSEVRPGRQGAEAAAAAHRRATARVALALIVRPRTPRVDVNGVALGRPGSSPASRRNVAIGRVSFPAAAREDRAARDEFLLAQRLRKAPTTILTPQA